MEKETAMKILKELHDNSLFSNRTALETLIPELADSNAEKIRKALIEMVHDTTGDELWVDYNVHKEEALAWLEKQDKSSDQIHYWTEEEIEPIIHDYLRGVEHYGGMIGRLRCLKPKSLEKQGTPAKLSEEEQNSFAKGVLSSCALSFINYLDAHSYEGKMCVSNGECEDIENAFHNAMWDRLHRYYCKYIEKQGEQKPAVVDFNAKDWYVSKVDGKIHDMTYNPADMVEPKFKVGDWIVNDYCMGRVVEITNDAYLLDIGQGIPFSCEHNTHLWTIQDANDGDVLIDKSHVGECVFIFKEARPSDIKTDVNNPLAIIGYCGINHIGFTSQLSGLGFGDTVNCTYYPATKEQRELLFKKMKEAGYEWDAEKKELKKIESTNIPENFEKYVEHLLSLSDGEGHGSPAKVKEVSAELFKLAKLEQNPVWSEEDETTRNALINLVEMYYGGCIDKSEKNRLLSWLKSLKDRIGG